MPIVPPAPIAGQVGPAGNLPYVQQDTFAQMIGEVQSWNPNADSSMVQKWINNHARKIYDLKLWYGNMRKGQLVTPGVYNTGQITVTLGSTTVVGTGTNWTASMIGRSIRVGYNTPIYNIVGVTDPTHLTIELPWGYQTLTNTGYYIVQYYYSIPNVKYIHVAINLQLQYQLRTNFNQRTLDARDPSRQQIMYPVALASMPPDPSGNYVCEMWPAPMTVQAIPYLAYVQPQNLVRDQDTLPAFIRCDIIKNLAISDCLLYRTKDNPRYSETMCLNISQRKMEEAQNDLLAMANADENLYRTDVETVSEGLAYRIDEYGYYTGGSTLAAMSPVGRGGWEGW